MEEIIFNFTRGLHQYLFDFVFYICQFFHTAGFAADIITASESLSCYLKNNRVLVRIRIVQAFVKLVRVFSAGFHLEISAKDSWFLLLTSRMFSNSQFWVASASSYHNSYDHSCPAPFSQKFYFGNVNDK